MSKRQRCAWDGCPARMDGQMVSCAAHWSLLPEWLRLEVIGTFDTLERQRRVGNPRRATRDELTAAIERARSEWRELHRQLEARNGAPVGNDGRTWLRVHQRLELERVEAGP